MKVLSKFWAFGLLSSLVISVLLSVSISVLTWFENPGGIFHDENGTNWHHIQETALSWFFPTFFYVFTIAALSHIAFTQLAKFFKK